MINQLFEMCDTFASLNKIYCNLLNQRELLSEYCNTLKLALQCIDDNIANEKYIKEIEKEESEIPILAADLENEIDKLIQKAQHVFIDLEDNELCVTSVPKKVPSTFSQRQLNKKLSKSSIERSGESQAHNSSAKGSKEETISTVKDKRKTSKRSIHKKTDAHFESNDGKLVKNYIVPKTQSEQPNFIPSGNLKVSSMQNTVNLNPNQVPQNVLMTVKNKASNREKKMPLKELYQKDFIEANKSAVHLKTKIKKLNADKALLKLTVDRKHTFMDVLKNRATSFDCSALTSNLDLNPAVLQNLDFVEDIKMLKKLNDKEKLSAYLPPLDFGKMLKVNDLSHQRNMISTLSEIYKRPNIKDQSSVESIRQVSSLIGEVKSFSALIASANYS